MPAKCPWCETNTHSDRDIKDYPTCERLFITRDEVYKLIKYNKADDTVHVIVAYPMGMLIGADYGVHEFTDLLDIANSFEIADPNGVARKMSHGICVDIDKNPQNCRFLETNDEALKAFEELHGHR